MSKTLLLRRRSDGFRVEIDGKEYRAHKAHYDADFEVVGVQPGAFLEPSDQSEVPL